jgi:hypothetical protein
MIETRVIVGRGAARMPGSIGGFSKGRQSDQPGPGGTALKASRKTIKLPKSDAVLQGI